MTHAELEARIRSHLEPLARDLGLEVWGMELGGGARQILRIYVEQPNGTGEEPDAASPEAGQGVGIEQCATLSRRLGLALEVEDVFPEAWTLEVSSPGFERPFFHCAQLPPYVGRDIEVVLAAPLDGWPGRKKFRGLLRRVDGEDLEIGLDSTQRRTDEPESVTLPWSHVRKAHLVHIFEEPEKPGKAKKSADTGKKLKKTGSGDEER